MKSIFDLKTSNADLSSSGQGLSNYRYQEVQSLRSIIGNNFANGEMIFRWTYGANKFWIPNKSYFRVRLKLVGAAAPLSYSDNCAFSMNTVPQMFQSMSYKISDQTVAAITENLAQIDTLKNRMNKEATWLNTVGQSNNMWASAYEERERKILSLGGNHLKSETQFKSWRQVIIEAKIANNDQYYITALPGGRYVLTLIDTADDNLDLTAITGLQIGDIINMTFTTAVTGVDALDINAYQIVSGVITAFTDLTITFMPNTFSIPTILVADAVAIGADTTFTLSFSRHSYYGDQNSTLATEIDLIWYPTLSIFDSVKHAIPCAGTKQEITLTPFPDSQWQRNIIESRGDNLDDGTDYSVTISDMRFYILTCDSNKIEENFTFMLDLNEVQCQPVQITNAAQQSTVDVLPSTNQITIAFQDQEALTNTLYPLSKFTIRGHIELALKRYYIRYEGQVPQPDFEGSISAVFDRRDLLLDYYNRTKIYDGSVFRASCETLEEYRDRGLYITHPFPKTASSRNTIVYIQTEFADLNATTPFLLVFSHSKKAVVCKVMNGKIVEISPYDV